MTNQINNPKQDGCPVWAQELIHKISEMEIKLGHLAPSGAWQIAKIEEILNRMQRDDTSFDESVVESLFAKVSIGLYEEGFSLEDIAEFVNIRIPSGKLPYCNVREVAEAIGH